MRIPMPEEKTFLADTLSCLYALQAGKRPQKCFIPPMASQGVYSYAGGPQENTFLRIPFTHLRAAGGRTSAKRMLSCGMCKWCFYLTLGKRPQKMCFLRFVLYPLPRLTCNCANVIEKGLKRPKSMTFVLFPSSR